MACPAATQLDEIAVLGHEVDRAATQVDSAATKDVPTLNPSLEKKKLEPLKPLTQEEWQKKEQKS